MKTRAKKNAAARAAFLKAQNEQPVRTPATTMHEAVERAKLRLGENAPSVDLVKAAIAELPTLAELVLAYDADYPGDGDQEITISARDWASWVRRAELDKERGL